jgi:HK97 gp10 family phage protein
MAQDVRIEGLEECLGAIEDVGDIGDYQSALEKACMMVVRTAVQNAPKNTGELRNSITYKIEMDGDNMTGVVYTPLEYAPYIEFGTGLFAEKGGRTDVPWCYKDDEGNWHSTSGMKPRPFLYPALDMNREEIIRILREATNND